MHGVCVDDDARTLVIVTELMARGSLRGALSDSHDGLYRCGRPIVAVTLRFCADAHVGICSFRKMQLAGQDILKWLLPWRRPRMLHGSQRAARRCATAWLRLLYRWERRGRRVALDIALGLRELHSTGVVHR